MSSSSKCWRFMVNVGKCMKAISVLPQVQNKLMRPLFTLFWTAWVKECSLPPTESNVSLGFHVCLGWMPVLSDAAVPELRSVRQLGICCCLQHFSKTQSEPALGERHVAIKAVKSNFTWLMWLGCSVMFLAILYCVLRLVNFLVLKVQLEQFSN